MNCTAKKNGQQGGETLLAELHDTSIIGVRPILGKCTSTPTAVVDSWRCCTSTLLAPLVAARRSRRLAVPRYGWPRFSPRWPRLTSHSPGRRGMARRHDGRAFARHPLPPARAGRSPLVAALAHPYRRLLGTLRYCNPVFVSSSLSHILGRFEHFQSRNSLSFQELRR